MSECSTLSSVLVGDQSRWSCRMVALDTVVLVTSHHYTDELIVQTVGDDVIVSDGGEVLARRQRRGEPRRQKPRRAVLEAAAGRPRDRAGPWPAAAPGRAGSEHTADLVQEMVDAGTSTASGCSRPYPAARPFLNA